MEGERAAHKVSFVLKLSTGLPRVMGDCIQLQQAVINLALNGIQAMAQVPERRRISKSGQN